MRYDAATGEYVPPPTADGYEDDEPHLILWERGRCWPPERNSVEHNCALAELGIGGSNHQDEFWIGELYGTRVCHIHRVYGCLHPPKRWRDFDGLVGPVLDEGRPVERAVFLDCRKPGRTAYVSALIYDGNDGIRRYVDIRPFAADIEELAWIIEYECPSHPQPARPWDPPSPDN